MGMKVSEAAGSRKPGKSAFDPPPFWKRNKAWLGGRKHHDFEQKVTVGFTPIEQLTTIGCIHPN
jgi:hypothetical protein